MLSALKQSLYTISFGISITFINGFIINDLIIYNNITFPIPQLQDISARVTDESPTLPPSFQLAIDITTCVGVVLSLVGLIVLVITYLVFKWVEIILSMSGMLFITEHLFLTHSIGVNYQETATQSCMMNTSLSVCNFIILLNGEIGIKYYKEFYGERFWHLLATPWCIFTS